MKAWRLNAQKINARRKAGSREQSARVQKTVQGPKMTYCTTWLLDALLLRGGYITLGLPTEAHVPPTDGWAKRVLRMFAKSKRWFGK